MEGATPQAADVTGDRCAGGQDDDGGERGPEGNAVDCHRNWEVLLLKRVPIMKRNPYLEECYKDYPILWVDDYADVNKSLLAENDDLFIKSRNLDINMLDLYSLFNRAVNRAKNT